MGDHWKSLANKLGAPGMDAPHSEPAPVAEPVRPTPPPRPAAPAKSESPRSDVQRTNTLHSEPARSEPVRSEPARSEPIRSESPRSESPQLDPPRADRGEVRSEPRRAAPRPAPAAELPAPEPEVRAPRPPVVQEPATPAKAKKKSSWDTLTSFFGISSSTPEAPEVSSAAPAETDALPGFNQPAARPSRDSDSRNTTSQNDRGPRAKATALDELFGEAPRQELSWDKPAPRRMIDDVSGWDDDQPVQRDSSLDDQADTFTPTGEEASSEEGVTDESTEPTRRRRRRRRGGSRRDGAERGERSGTDADRPERTARGGAAQSPAPGPSDEFAEAWEEELADVEASDPWSEPASFDVASESLDVEIDIDAELDPDAPLPQRRSNRRRRRGRGRSDRDPEGSLPAATDATGDFREPRPPREPREARDATRTPRPPREPREPREVREPREPREPRVFDEAAEIVDDAAVERAPERARREPREGREPRQGRQPREGRQRSERSPRSDAPRREPVAAVDDIDNQVDSSLAAELEGDDGAGNRHPKIPTWADSLEAIISANMENHRRNDSRGGGSRGRPRSNNNPPRRP